jgi:hypothetical protein
MVKRFSYQHPGYAFLNRYGSLQGEADVLHYAEFLRQEAGLTEDPPIDLAPIYKTFCIPDPLRIGLEEQQGILLDSYKGLILIKETDSIVRQRFTEGHELMELLFDAQDDIQADLGIAATWDEARKEQLCDAGAAELLMPRSTFPRRLSQLGMSLATGRKLAEAYQTSRLATFIRMVELTDSNTALLVCRVALKPTEQRRATPAEPKMRIWWRRLSPAWTGGFIPKDKSIAPESLIVRSAQSGQAQIGEETFTWGGHTIQARVEALPVQMNQTTCVITLLQLITR